MPYSVLCYNAQSSFWQNEPNWSCSPSPQRRYCRVKSATSNGRRSGGSADLADRLEAVKLIDAPLRHRPRHQRLVRREAFGGTPGKKRSAGLALASSCMNGWLEKAAIRQRKARRDLEKP